MNRSVCSDVARRSPAFPGGRLVRALALGVFALLPTVLTAQEPGVGPAEQGEPVQAEAPIEEQIAALIKQLSARYYDDRESAREELERIGAPAEPFLIAALKDSDFRVRYYAASVLGKIGSENCLDALVAAIGDEDSSVAAAVRQALLHFGNKALDAIDKRKKACPESAETLDEIVNNFASAGVEAVLQKYLISNGSVGFFPGMFDEIVKIGKSAVPTLLSIATDPYHEFADPLPALVNPVMMRRLAVDALGDAGDKSVISELKKIADGDVEDDYVVGARGYLADAAAFALYKLGDTSYVDAKRQQLEQAIEAWKD